MPLKQRDLIGHIIHTARCIERMCDNYARQTGVTGSQSRLLCFLSIVSLEQDVYQKDIEEELESGLLQQPVFCRLWNCRDSSAENPYP